MAAIKRGDILICNKPARGYAELKNKICRLLAIDSHGQYSVKWISPVSSPVRTGMYPEQFRPASKFTMALYGDFDYFISLNDDNY